jgi:hypothetical protein
VGTADPLSSKSSVNPSFTKTAQTARRPKVAQGTPSRWAMSFADAILSRQGTIT